jgi:3-oxoadipate enol-lactonase
MKGIYSTKKIIHRSEALVTTQKNTAFALTRDNTKLHYTLHSGEKRGCPRIVLVHSLAMDGEFWNPVVDLLTPYADVLTYDCRGHGKSDKPSGPYSIPQFADDLHDLLQHLGWPSTAVAGASMGGVVALGFAINHPQHTHGLGLLDTTAWYGADAPKNWAERATKARAEGMQALLPFQKTRWFCEEFQEQHPEVLEKCIDVFLKNEIHAFDATCHMLGGFDLRSGLANIKTKTAIAVGEEDYATPIAMAEILHEGIKDSSLEVLPKARHLTPLECPEKIADILKNIL